MNVLQETRGIYLEINVWGGKRAISIEELLPVGVEVNDLLPPGEVADKSISSKLVDSDDIKAFTSLRKRFSRFLDAVGVRFMGGWLVPKDKLDEVISGLESLETEFFDLKRDFLRDFEDKVETFLEKWGERATAVRRYVPTVDEVSRKFDCSFSIYEVTQPAEEGNPLNQRMQKAVEQVADTLFEEVAKAAGQVYKKSFMSDKASQKAVKSVVGILDKLEGMQSATRLAEPLVAHIRDHMAKLPKTGYVTGRDLNAMQACLLLLANPDFAKQHAQAILEGGSPSIFNAARATVGDIDWDNALGDEPEDEPADDNAATPASNGGLDDLDWDNALTGGSDDEFEDDVPFGDLGSLSDADFDVDLSTDNESDPVEESTMPESSEGLSDLEWSADVFGDLESDLDALDADGTSESLDDFDFEMDSPIPDSDEAGDFSASSLETLGF